MLSKSLSTSEKFAALVPKAGPLAEFCHALYPLLIPHTDDFGRLQGDPFTVKHVCYPASARTLDEFADALRLLHDAELIIWYQVTGKRFIQITQFEMHQSGLHKRTRSQFPRVPGTSGNDAEIPGQENGREEKRTEEKRTKKGGAKESAQPVRPAFEHYHALFVARYHGKPEYAGEKDGARMKRLLLAHGLDEIKRRVEAFFDSRDPWIQQSGHTLDVFFASGTQTKLVASIGQRQDARPKCCKHIPACQDDASHTSLDMAERRRAVS